MIEVIEVIAALVRWLALASNMILIGGCVFLAIAGRERAAFDNQWFACLKRALPWLAISLLLGLLGLLATTTAQVTGVAANPGLAQYMQVGVIDQAGGYAAISGTETALHKSDEERKARELKDATKNVAAPKL